MLTRREAFRRALVSGAVLGGRAAFARASQPSTAVNFDVPPDSCDCHTHVIGDPARFPLWSGRPYTPEPASPEEMAAMHSALHIRRVVIVTPSVYGTDNSATLYGLKARGADARGVAVIDERTTDRELDTMASAGVRGIRLNLSAGRTSPEAARQRLQASFGRMKQRGWHIQVYAELPIVAAIKDLVLDSPVPVVFDHFGGAKAAGGTEQPGFADLIELAGSGKAYVKISGAYRASMLAPDYSDVAPFARALVAANADRILWGTDWPHPDTTVRKGHTPMDTSPMLQIDDGRLLNRLPVWVPDAATRERILVRNPARLYGF